MGIQAQAVLVSLLEDHFHLLLGISVSPFLGAASPRMLVFRSFIQQNQLSGSEERLEKIEGTHVTCPDYHSKAE